MRNLSKLEKFRLKTDWVLQMFGGYGDDTCGVFAVRSPTDGKALVAIASVGDGWDHVSVSREDRVPDWDEMCRVKDMFFEPEEVAVQIHPRQSEYVNFAKNCLHLWRPTDDHFKPPAKYLVGAPA